MNKDLSEHNGEEKIEDVLKQVKKEFANASLDGASTGHEEQVRPQEAKENELKNLKNVLLEADLQAGSTPAKKDAVASGDQGGKKKISFNESFLKLEQMIKDLKRR